jgi:hypothetical protein
MDILLLGLVVIVGTAAGFAAGALGTLLIYHDLYCTPIFALWLCK